MKVILPVAGVGTRLRPLTLHLPKCLLPVAGNTILGHILDALAPLQISEFIFVTGYQSEKVEAYIHKSYAHLPSRFVQQANPQGLGEAIHLCSPHLQDNEPVLIVLGDTLFEADLAALTSAEQNVLCTRFVSDPARFGVAIADSNGDISKLVEKPKTFVSNQALVGIYYIRDVLALRQSLEHLIQNNIRTRGEYQLTDALQHMIESGSHFRTGEIQGWLDCGKPDTLLETNRHLLKTHGPSGARDYPDSTIIEPCHIGANVKLSGCIIGPNVSIHENCQLTATMLQDSVVAANSLLDNAALSRSMLGESVVVRRFQGSLHLGDHSSINPEG